MSVRFQHHFAPSIPLAAPILHVAKFNMEINSENSDGMRFAHAVFLY